jgi:hypothetical protein
VIKASRPSAAIVVIECKVAPDRKENIEARLPNIDITSLGLRLSYIVRRSFSCSRHTQRSTTPMLISRGGRYAAHLK